MCTTKYYRCRRCNHHWLVLISPCGFGMNLSTCPMFQDGALNWVSRLPPHRVKWWAPIGQCIHCDLDTYDVNFTRMIKSVRNGVRVGLAPSKKHPGVDLGCRVM